MYLVHVSARGYPIAEALRFPCSQAFKANRRRRHDKHNQIGRSNQRLSPAHT